MFNSEKRQARQRINEQIGQLEANLKKSEELIGREFEQYKASQVDKWEYMVVDPVDVRGLNELGREGWELASIAPYEATERLGPGMSISTRYIFKRKLCPIPPDLFEQVMSKYKTDVIRDKLVDLRRQLAQF